MKSMHSSPVSWFCMFYSCVIVTCDTLHHVQHINNVNVNNRIQIDKGSSREREGQDGLRLL